MTKAGVFLILAGVASLGLGVVTRWDGFLEDRRPFSPQLDILTSRAPNHTRPGLAPEGWRTSAPAGARVTAPPQSERTASGHFAMASRSGESPADPATLPMPHDRASLVRELQRGLKRVGCYEAEVSGVWTQQSRSAMRAFTGRINAALPVDEPDGVLLALVRGHKDKACGMPCPPGEGVAADGRCLPNALLAHAKKMTEPQTIAAIEHSQPPTTPSARGWTSATAVASPEAPAPPEGRMSLAGPSADPTTATRPMSVDTNAPAPRVPFDVSGNGRFGPSFFRQLDRRGNN
jgi:hypothetical protein